MFSLDFQPILHSTAQMVLDLAPLAISVLTPVLVMRANDLLKAHTVTKDIQISSAQQDMLEKLALTYVRAHQEKQNAARKDDSVPTPKGTELKDTVLGLLGMEMLGVPTSRLDAAIDAAVDLVRKEEQP